MLEQEEKIKQDLETKFLFLKDLVLVKRERRIFAEVLDKNNFQDIFEYAVMEMKFSQLCVITGLDNAADFIVIYHFTRDNKILLNIKVHIPKNEAEIETITRFFPNADIYEREIMDLLGIRFNELAHGHRYPLPDKWPKGDYPLRKEWKESEVNFCE